MSSSTRTALLSLDSAFVFVETSVGAAPTSVILRTLLLSKDRSSSSGGKVVVVQTEPQRDQLLSSGEEEGEPASAVLLDFCSCDDYEAKRKSLDVAEILDAIRSAEEKNPKITLVINTLTPVLFENSAARVTKLLLALRKDKRICQLVVVCLRDCHDRGVLSHLRGISQTSITILPEVDHAESGSVKVTVRHRPVSGKAVSTTELVNLNPKSGEITKVACQGQGKQQASSKGQQQQQEQQQQQRQVLDDLTTFNLGLRDEERSAREKVVLPFWRPEQKQEAEQEEVRLNSRASSGKIFYQPDAADDWDEEDPDDDLDF